MKISKNHTSNFLSSIKATASIGVTNAALSLLMTMLLARILGPEGFGVYSLAFSLAMILSIPTQAGLPTLLIREISKYSTHEKWSLIRGIVRRSNQMAAVLIAVTVGIAINYAPARLEPKYLYIASLLLIPLVTFGNIRGGALQGLGYVGLGQAPENLIRPVLALAALLCYWAIPGAVVTPWLAMIFQVVGSLSAVIFGHFVFNKVICPEYKRAKPDYSEMLWFRSLAPLGLISGIQILNLQIGTVILGAMRSSAEVGYYRAAFQISMIMSFGLIIINNTAAHHLAKAHAIAANSALQEIVRKCAKLTLMYATPTFLGCVLLGEVGIELLFGDAYSSSYMSLVILSLGLIVSAMLGPTVQLMNMTGNEKHTIIGVSLATAINILLCVALVGRLGPAGAAFAASASLVLLNIYLSLVARKNLGIKCLAF